MTDTHPHNDTAPWRSFLKILRGRRSRRFGLGMKMASGPMAYESEHAGLPLTEEEEALLAFAACGVTGYALADLVYDRGQGGTIMAGLVGHSKRGCHPDLLIDGDEPGGHLLHQATSGLSA